LKETEAGAVPEHWKVKRFDEFATLLYFPRLSHVP
jgi:hypothetical protein